jgi:ABC-type transport system involved in cytochrome c biogenesis permease subunit
MVVLATCLAYLPTAVLHLASLVEPSERRQRAARWTLEAAIVLHVVALAVMLLTGGVGALAGLWQAVFGVSLAASIAYRFLLWRAQLPVLGALLTSFAAVALYALFVNVRHSEPIPPRLVRVISPVHVWSSVLGSLAFVVSLAASAAYLVQNRRLKRKQLRKFGAHAVALETLDRAAFRSILVGFLLYTVGIVLGAIWAVKASGSFVEPQYILAGVSWVCYGAILHARLTVGWKGRRAALFTVVAFLGALAAALIYAFRIRG